MPTKPCGVLYFGLLQAGFKVMSRGANLAWPTLPCRGVEKQRGFAGAPEKLHDTEHRQYIPCRCGVGHCCSRRRSRSLVDIASPTVRCHERSEQRTLGLSRLLAGESCRHSEEHGKCLSRCEQPWHEGGATDRQHEPERKKKRSGTFS